MSLTTIQVAYSRSVGMYESSQQFGMWKDVPQATSDLAVPSSFVRGETSQHHKGEYASGNPAGQSDNDQESSRLDDKIKRRLAQNREAARKSRLRKKAYVQQLETSRLKLTQLEHELEQAKLQNLCASHAYLRRDINAGIAAFEMKYDNWLKEQSNRTCELRNALNANASNAELRILVDGNLNHYYSLLRMKAEIAKVDVFYLMSGAWKTSVERFFLWIGGVRPSEVIKVVRPCLNSLTEQQQADINKLCQSSQQAEDALSQGLDKLQQSLREVMLDDRSHNPMAMINAREKLTAVTGFLTEADNLREKNLYLMSRNLTTHQAARGLLALGDYFHRLSTVSAMWASR